MNIKTLKEGIGKLNPRKLTLSTFASLALLLGMQTATAADIERTLNTPASTISAMSGHHEPTEKYDGAMDSEQPTIEQLEMLLEYAITQEEREAIKAQIKELEEKTK